jgi:hypothetical protein
VKNQLVPGMCALRYSVKAQELDQRLCVSIHAVRTSPHPTPATRAAGPLPGRQDGPDRNAFSGQPHHAAQLGAGDDMAVDAVEDGQLLLVQGVGPGGAAVLHQDDVEARRAQ